MRLGIGSRTSSNCPICGRAGVVPFGRSALCSFCVPIGYSLDSLSIDDVKSLHIKDSVLIERIESFVETERFNDLRFDDEHRLFFKGPYPNYTIPVLSYDEIAGYSLNIDETPMAYNSVDGQRAKFRVATDANIKAACKNMERLILQVDSRRSNVRFRPYEIKVGSSRFSGNQKEESFRLALKVSDKFDSIIENNIFNCRNASSN